MEAPQPWIVAFVADLFFFVKIDAAAKELDFQVEWIERATQVAPLDPDAPSRQPAERLIGPGTVLLDKLTLLRPALLIFDLGNAGFLAAVACVDKIVAGNPAYQQRFGSHVDVDTLKTARSCGADSCFPLPGL
jgi:hypothetical protein